MSAKTDEILDVVKAKLLAAVRNDPAYLNREPCVVPGGADCSIVFLTCYQGREQSYHVSGSLPSVWSTPRQPAPAKYAFTDVDVLAPVMLSDRWYPTAWATMLLDRVEWQDGPGSGRTIRVDLGVYRPGNKAGGS